MKFNPCLIKCQLRGTGLSGGAPFYINECDSFQFVVYYPMPGDNYVHRAVLVDIEKPLSDFIENHLPVMIKEIESEIKAMADILD